MSRILVVDDETDLLAAVEAVLADEGHEVVAASNGREAIEHLAKAQPDLVLLDYMMPFVDGLEVLARIRGDERLSNTAVVLMSAVKPPSPPEDASWDAFLQKPFSLDRLLETIERVLGNPG